MRLSLWSGIVFLLIHLEADNVSTIGGKEAPSFTNVENNLAE